MFEQQRSVKTVRQGARTPSLSTSVLATIASLLATPYAMINEPARHGCDISPGLVLYIIPVATGLCHSKLSKVWTPKTYVYTSFVAVAAFGKT